MALKSAAPRKAADVAADDGDKSATLPPLVANANAQLASADTPAGAAKAMSARASTILRAVPDTPADAKTTTETQVVSADQLNDVDRALHDSTPPALTLASADPPAAPVMARANDSSIWDKTSLIGKMFMAFGVMLTLASAARMFMA
jgi:phage-related tail fiber protein